MKRSIILFALLALASCEIHFDLDKTSEPAMYVQYLPSPELDARIMVAYAEPAFDKPATKPHPFDISDVTITVNGAGAKVSEDTLSSWNRHVLIVSTPSPIKPGDEISVTVTGKDVPVATASTRVPERPVIKSATFSQEVRDTTDVWKVTIKLDKPVADNEFYALKAIKHSEWYSASGPDLMHLQIDTTGYTECFNPGQIIDFTNLNSLDLDNYVTVGYEDGFITSDYFSGEFMTLLAGTKFEGDTYTFYINSTDTSLWSDFDFDFGGVPGSDNFSDFPDDEYYDYDDPDGEEYPEEPEIWMYLGEKSKYRFEIYHLSDEFYRYAKAQYLSNYNMLSNFGITPPNFTYTNVSGGLGIVAGIAGSGTDWIAPPEKEDAE